MLIKYELLRILKTKKSIFLISFIILIPIMDLLFNLYNIYGDYWLHPEYYTNGPNYILHPSIAAFLSGISIGHVAQMLLIWVLPLYLLVIYSDSYILEKRVGYHNIIYSKCSRKQIINTRLFISFALPFVVSFIALGLNFLLANIFFNGGQEFGGVETIAAPHAILALSLQHPTLAYCIYLLLFCLIAGGYGVVCTGICMFIPQYKIAYPLAFFLWILLIASPISITYIIQPFIEYGLHYIIPALAIFFIIVFATILLCNWKKVVADEI